MSSASALSISKMTSSRGLFEKRRDYCLRATIQRLGGTPAPCRTAPRGHSGVLAALAGEQPRGLGRVMCDSPRTSTWGRAVVCRVLLSSSGGGFSRIDHQRGPVLQVRSPRPSSQAQIGKSGLRMRAQPAAVLVGDLHQARSGVRAESGSNDKIRAASFSLRSIFRSVGPCRSALGASSRMTCAFVPAKPNELTPAIGG